MLPYQHAGGIVVQRLPQRRRALRPRARRRSCPSAWRKVMGERDGKKPYQNLWIISRGPTSHGCTRLASGHMSELRQILPSELRASGARRHVPQPAAVLRRLRHRRRRHARGDGRAVLPRLQEPRAHADRVLRDQPARAVLPLALRRQHRHGARSGTRASSRCRSAASSARRPTKRRRSRTCRSTKRRSRRSTIQFYRIKSVAFDSTPGFELNRELRKVGAGHVLDRGKLLAEMTTQRNGVAVVRTTLIALAGL